LRKIDLRPYTIEIPSPNGEEKTKIPLNVSQWIQDVIFHPDLKLDGRETILRGKLADKIAEAKGEVLLEEADYHKIKTAFETIKGFGKMHIELLNRVFEAPTVEVEPKKK